MIRRLGLTLLFLALAAPCLAQKVYIDYDRAVEFDEFETFQWYASEETSVQETDPLVHAKIVEAIRAQLAEGGMSEVDSDPDLYVTYHTNEKEELSLDTTRFGYDYASTFHWDPYWGHGPSMGAASTHVYTYPRGTLVIDLWDPKTEKLVWRGSAAGVVKEDPRKAEKQIQKAIKKIARKWDELVEKGLQR